MHLPWSTRAAGARRWRRRRSGRRSRRSAPPRRAAGARTSRCQAPRPQRGSAAACWAHRGWRYLQACSPAHERMCGKGIWQARQALLSCQSSVHGVCASPHAGMLDATACGACPGDRVCPQPMWPVICLACVLSTYPRRSHAAYLRETCMHAGACDAGRPRACSLRAAMEKR